MATTTDPPSPSPSTPIDYDYDADAEELFWIDPEERQRIAALRLLYVTAYSLALIGLPLNLAAIAAVFRYKQQLRRWTQILGLAAAHLLRCVFLPLYLHSAWRSFSWELGGSACKLGSFSTLLCMFSSTLVLTFWSLRWCVPEVTRQGDDGSSRVKLFFCPVPKRLLPVPGSTVLLSWFLGAVLAIPSLLSMELQESEWTQGPICTENFNFSRGEKSQSAVALQRKKAVMVCRFLFGLLLPLVVIGVSRCVRGRRGRRTQTPRGGETDSQVLWPATVSHFVLWAPLLTLWLLSVTDAMRGSSVLAYGLPACTALSALDSLVCPLLCLWKGKADVQQEGYGSAATTGDEHEMSSPA